VNLQTAPEQILTLSAECFRVSVVARCVTVHSIGPITSLLCADVAPLALWAEAVRNLFPCCSDTAVTHSMVLHA